MWKAIPFGFLLKAHPTVIFLMSASGGMIGVILLYLFGNKLKKYLFRKKGPASNMKKSSRVNKLFERYGVAGLGFFGCILIGPPLTILLGVAIVKSHQKLLLWVLAGTVFWSFSLTLAGYYSIELFHEITSQVKLF